MKKSNEDRESIKISVAELKRRLPGPKPPLILDVREPIELSEGRIDGSLHIPLRQVLRRIGELPRDKPFVIVCASGARSLMVARFLSEKGFSC